MSNPEWWWPRRGTVFLRSLHTINSSTYEESREEWMGQVLDYVIDKWKNTSILIRREDTGEELIIDGSYWWNLTNNIWKGNKVEVIWAPGWWCPSLPRRSRIGGPCG
jgi:hypothetical protein